MGASEKKKASKKKSASKKNPVKKVPKSEPAKKPLPKPEPKEVKPEPKIDEEPKPTDKPKLLEKKIPIEKPKPKPKPKPEPKKKPEPKSLFDDIDTDKPDVKEKESEDSREQQERISENKKKSDSLKNVKNSDMGVVDAYKAKIEKKLQDWPAQSEFAGETLVMRLKIRPDGTFEFKILTPSNNQDFNIGLVQYLEQLQKIGFDSHSNSKPYEFDVEFIAKE